MELPKIISVDDHVVEPPHVWQTWLPARFREKGPRVERHSWAPFVHMAGARYVNTIDPEGVPGDAWFYEDRLIYVHKKFVAIPLEATPDGDLSRFDRTKMQMVPSTYDDMRPGCYERDARVADFQANWMDGSLPFPTFPRFCGQTFMEGNDKELGLACVRAYNDWMVEEWCEPSGGMNIPLGIIPMWDPALAVAEVERVADKGVHAICFSEIPSKLGLPSIHTDHWDQLFAVCNDRAVTLCMHIGSSSTNPTASPDAPEAVGSALAFNNAFASLVD
ncbi:MAG: amidohydrolase family protein, partial [Gemmatimonadaceae bacterium]